MNVFFTAAILHYKKHGLDYGLALPFLVLYAGRESNILSTLGLL